MENGDGWQGAPAGVIESTLRLGDGRVVGVAEFGDRDAPALVYCHGFPTNRQELRLLQPVLERNGVEVRVVAVNRPGYGPSSFVAHRGFTDWPRDVVDVADLLGIGDFAVLGVSGGAPFALACGQALGSRVRRVGIIVGVAPREAPGMSGASAIAQPSRYRFVRQAQFAMAAVALRKGQEDRFVDRSISTMGPPDRAAMAVPGTRAWMTETLRESFQQDGRAAALEAGLYRKPWGFDLASVTMETGLWYAGCDETVPEAAGRWLAERLPNSRFVLWPDHGHFTWMTSDDAAVAIAATVR